jgi:hypothetical protein
MSFTNESIQTLYALTQGQETPWLLLWQVQRLSILKSDSTEVIIHT